MRRSQAYSDACGLCAVVAAGLRFGTGPRIALGRTHRGAPLADGGVAMSERRGAACFVGALCLYGTVGWVLSCIDMPSDVVVLCRGAIGCAFVAAVLLASRRGVDWAAVRANVPWLCVGGLSLGLNWVLLFAAYRATTVAVATLCNYMAPPSC